MTIWLDGTSGKYPKKTEAGGRHIGGVLGEEPPNVNPGGSGEARKPPPVASFRSAAPVRGRSEDGADGGDEWYANDAQQRKNNTICLAGILACWLACWFAGWLACWLADCMAIWLDRNLQETQQTNERKGLA
jgi:hypothetical protein